MQTRFLTALLVLALSVTATGCLHLGEPRGHPPTPYEPEVQQRLESRDVPETHPNATLQDANIVEYWIVAFVNHERIESGKEPLVWSPRLAQVADYRSYDMWKRDYFSHISPNGTDYTVYLEDYQYNNWNDVAENIYGKGYKIRTSDPVENTDIIYKTPRGLARALVRGWMISGPHRWAMMHGDYSVTGVGVYGEPDGSTKATQLFADRERFDEAVDASTTEQFRVPIADEDPMEDETPLEPYPEHLGPNTPNDE